jgi:hypothetical protein
VRDPEVAEVSVERTELVEQSTAELVRRASEQISGLVRAEVALAKAEVADKGKRAGMGAGMLGGAGVVALYGVAVLLATIVLLLALVMPAWSAALIVTVVLFAGAAALALLGRASLKRALPPVPEKAVASVKADLDAARSAVTDRHVNAERLSHDRLNDAHLNANNAEVASNLNPDRAHR